ADLAVAGCRRIMDGASVLEEEDLIGHAVQQEQGTFDAARAFREVELADDRQRIARPSHGAELLDEARIAIEDFHRSRRAAGHAAGGEARVLGRGARSEVPAHAVAPDADALGDAAIVNKMCTDRGERFVYIRGEIQVVEEARLALPGTVDQQCGDAALDEVLSARE